MSEELRIVVPDDFEYRGWTGGRAAYAAFEAEAGVLTDDVVAWYIEDDE